MARFPSAAVDPQHRGSALRITSDPLLQPLLVASPASPSGWQPIGRCRDLLRQGALDAALISVAAMAAGRRAAAQSLLAATLQPPISVIPLGERPLLLLHAPWRQHATDPDATVCTASPWQQLLPPAEQQPLLWRQLQQLGLLPLRCCRAHTAEGVLQDLQQGPLLLPAPLTLLQEMPWREAGLRAVPPPEPLSEWLALLVRQEEEGSPAIEALTQRLRQRLDRDRQAIG